MCIRDRVVVGKTNNATAWVDELVFDASVAKAFGGVEKDNGIIPTKVGGLFIQHGDGFGEAEMANIVGFGVDGLISAEAGGLNGSGCGDDFVSSDCGAAIEFDGGGFIPARMDLLDTTLHFADAAEAAILVLKEFHDHAHAVEWSGETFEKEGAKHNGCLLYTSDAADE